MAGWHFAFLKLSWIARVFRVESDNKVLFISKKTIHLSRDPYHLEFQICVCVCLISKKASQVDMGVSLNGATSKTPQNDHF